MNLRGRSLNANSDKDIKNMYVRGILPFKDEQVDHSKQEEKEIKPKHE